jgi:uncharacterized integral membrane protein
MRIKTIVIIVITILLTVVLMQNTEKVKFTFLFTDIYIPKLVMMTLVSVIAFILGVLVGRPKRIKRLGGDNVENNLDKEKSGTLSDEDKDYIN